MCKVANIVFNSFENDSRVIKESQSLSKAGFDVTVIAHGAKNLAKYEQKDGFKVVRFAKLDRQRVKSNLKKLLVYILWLQKVIIYAKDFEILHCNDLNTLPVAAVIKKFFNRDIKVLYDAHEYETETYALKGLRKIITKWAERFLIRYADRVITVSESIANEYVKLYGIQKPALVLNTPYLQEVTKNDNFRKKFGIEEQRKIYLYQGALTPNRGIELLIKTFQILEEEKGNLSPVVVFMGYGDLKTLIEQASRASRAIYLHEAVAPERILEYTSSADFGISMIEDSCLSYRYALPNKIFEYMMAGIPVIVSNLPEMRAIIEQYGVGVVAKEQSVASLKWAIEESLKLDTNKLMKNLERVKKHYNWLEQERVLLDIYSQLQDKKGLSYG